jgi:hypothetical protein
LNKKKGIYNGKQTFVVIFFKKVTPKKRLAPLHCQGIVCRVEGNRIVFTAGETTATFEVLETAQVLTNRTEEAEIIVTLAENGGLQVKSRL